MTQISGSHLELLGSLLFARSSNDVYSRRQAREFILKHMPLSLDYHSLENQVRHQAHHRLVQAAHQAIAGGDLPVQAAKFIASHIPQGRVLVQTYYGPLSEDPQFKNDIVGVAVAGSLVKQGNFLVTKQPLLVSDFAKVVVCEIQEGEAKTRCAFRIGQEGVRKFFPGQTAFKNYFALKVQIPQQKAKKVAKGLSSLNDELCSLVLAYLYNALQIAIEYTSMRRQFKSTDDKSERVIGTYQVVKQRIAVAFAKLTAFSMLHIRRPKFLQKSSLSLQVFTEIATLRQCMGGFGYLAVSGMPRMMEASRAECWGYTADSLQWAEPVRQQAVTIYSKIQPQIKWENSESNPALLSYFLFLQSITKDEHMGRELAHLLACVTTIHSDIVYGSSAIVPVLSFTLTLLAVSHILKEGKLHAKEKAEELKLLLRSMRSKAIAFLCECLPMVTSESRKSRLGHILFGREDSALFYEELFRYSKEVNSANRPEFIQQSHKVLREFIRQNAESAKL